MTMSSDCLLLDTVFIQAILNKHDQHHKAAMDVLAQVRTARQVWVTEAVFQEAAAALSTLNRVGVAAFIRQCYATSNIHVVNVDSRLFMSALSLYENRPDKAWSLTDCISFVVMDEHNLREAVTNDHHFVQAGYRILL